jgi:hypothetical protein
MISTERVYALLGNESLWDVAKTCHQVLRDAGIPYAVAGGVAVCLHGYQRNTVDLDLVVRADRSNDIRQELERFRFKWDTTQREFHSPSGVAVQFLFAGERAGRNSDVNLPDPVDSQSVIELEGLSVLSLARLIESKIACGQSNLRRTHKDFADVVELVARHELGRDFARHLHKSVRPTFRQLVGLLTGRRSRATFNWQLPTAS